MKIGIDARLYGLEHTGIGRYVLELVTNLLALDQTNDYVLFLRADDYYSFPDHPRVKKVLADIRHYTLAEQLALPRIIDQEKLDLVHLPHFNVPIFLRTPFVATIHDLLWHDVVGYHVTTLNPFTYTLKYLAYRFIVKHAVTYARALIVPSVWVKTKLIQRFHLPPASISVTYEGVGKSFTHPEADLTSDSRSFTIKPPYIVYTGSLYPHKNVAVILQALRDINKSISPKLSLVLISARSVFTDRFRKLAYDLDQEKYVKFTGFLSDAEIVRLYHQAIALVHPSLSEGFGLTGLEAMAAGLPVISSTAASLPEVYGEAALYFNPRDANQLKQKIMRLVKDKHLRATLSAAGLKQADKYSWRTMAKNTLAVYEHSFRLRSPQ